MSDILYAIAVWAVPVLFAITLHEAAHGWAANKLGDPTAFNLGRISMNPMRHIDPVGTIIIPLFTLISVGVAFGAAKPVPVDTRNFKQPQLDMAYVALAGPGSNFIMALLWAALIAVSLHYSEYVPWAKTLQHVGQAGVAINLIIMSLNLLPVPPLDGSKVIAGVMPLAWARKYVQFERFGFVFLIALIFIEIGFKVPVFSSILYFLVKPFMLFFETLFNFKGMYF